jgi:hypothetical protein
MGQLLTPMSWIRSAMYSADFLGFEGLLGRGAVRHLLLVACLGAAFGVAVPVPSAGQNNGVPTAKMIDFDIPAQPLADALVAYGAATGGEVYYDGSWAIGRRSALLKGKFTPEAALATLLRGSGYVPLATSPNIFMLTAAPDAAPASAHVSDGLIRQYESYFAALQARIVQALCGTDMGQTSEIIFSVSVDGAGIVSRAEILDSSGNPARDARISTALRGSSIGRLPPAGLPQPTTMAVFRPLPGEVPGCAEPGNSQSGP